MSLDHKEHAAESLMIAVLHARNEQNQLMGLSLGPREAIGWVEAIIASKKAERQDEIDRAERLGVILDKANAQPPSD